MAVVPADVGRLLGLFDTDEFVFRAEAVGRPLEPHEPLQTTLLPLEFDFQASALFKQPALFTFVLVAPKIHLPRADGSGGEGEGNGRGHLASLYIIVPRYLNRGDAIALLSKMEELVVHEGPTGIETSARTSLFRRTRLVVEEENVELVRGLLTGNLAPDEASTFHVLSSKRIEAEEAELVEIADQQRAEHEEHEEREVEGAHMPRNQMEGLTELDKEAVGEDATANTSADVSGDWETEDEFAPDTSLALPRSRIERTPELDPSGVGDDLSPDTSAELADFAGLPHAEDDADANTSAISSFSAYERDRVDPKDVNPNHVTEDEDEEDGPNRSFFNNTTRPRLSVGPCHARADSVSDDDSTFEDQPPPPPPGPISAARRTFLVPIAPGACDSP